MSEVLSGWQLVDNEGDTLDLPCCEVCLMPVLASRASHGRSERNAEDERRLFQSRVIRQHLSVRVSRSSHMDFTSMFETSA